MVNNFFSRDFHFKDTLDHFPEYYATLPYKTPSTGLEKLLFLQFLVLARSDFDI